MSDESTEAIVFILHLEDRSHASNVMGENTDFFFKCINGWITITIATKRVSG